MEEKQRYEKTLKYYFLMYGQHDQTERIKAYAEKLKVIPIDILKAILNKLVFTNNRVASIAEIMEAGASLSNTVNGSEEINWQEAQREIMIGMRRTWYKGCLGEIPDTDPEYGKPCEPMWSTPEIKAAVDAYGFENFQLVLAEDMPIVWAQLRRLYEQAYQKRRERDINRRVLKNLSGLGLENFGKLPDYSLTRLEGGQKTS